MDNAGKGSRWKVGRPDELRMHKFDQTHMGQAAGIAGRSLRDRDANRDLIAATGSIPETKEIGIADCANEVVVIIFGISVSIKPIEGAPSKDLHDWTRFGGGTGRSTSAGLCPNGPSHQN